MRTIDQESLMNELGEFAPNAMIAPARDNLLFCPELSWVKEFGSYCFQHPKRPYAPSKYDCDKFCITALDDAYDSLNENTSIEKLGCTVFLVYILIDKGYTLNHVGSLEEETSHATLLIRTNEDKYYYLEPQNGEITLASTVKSFVDIQFVLL